MNNLTKYHAYAQAFTLNYGHRFNYNDRRFVVADNGSYGNYILAIDTDAMEYHFINDAAEVDYIPFPISIEKMEQYIAYADAVQYPYTKGFIKDHSAGSREYSKQVAAHEMAVHNLGLTSEQIDELPF